MKTRNITNNTNRQLRNIGIIAHVDAGKTTVSERILYYTGEIHRTSEVHQGGATMDFKPWEQAHGITVSSAATTVEWKDHTLSIIDTPGHIDFNIEVKRALRVLDGAIVVFDAVAGVEPQTETNWRLADEFAVPRIALVNKMDRTGASYAGVCEMMQEKFANTILPLHLPLHEENGEFTGLIDIITGTKHTWTDGEIQSESAENLSIVSELREQIVETLAMIDERILEAWDTGETITNEILNKAIRIATISGEIVPVLCGTALKNMGVELLLDAVISFLPAPCDVAQEFEVDSTLVYAFKTEAQQHQTLTFCRVYQGSVSVGDTLWNTNTGERERIGRIQRILADKTKPLETAHEGEIIAIVGLKSTHMGHTLCSENVDFKLELLSVPETVVAMAIEAKNSDQRDKIAETLKLLITEDPTLKMSSDPETSQLILAGMGGLHLKITCEKLEAISGCQIQLGKPQVSYRETITTAATVDHLLSKQTGGPGMYAGLTIEIEPLEPGAGFEFVSTVTGGSIAQEYVPAVEKGIKRRLLNGILGANPVVDVKVTLTDGKMHSNDSSQRAFEIAAFEAMEKALHICNSVLLEPIMKTHIECQTDAMGSVIGDINRRLGVINQQDMQGNGITIINAEVPLVNLFGAADDLRSLTSGRSTFSMEFAHYQPVA